MAAFCGHWLAVGLSAAGQAFGGAPGPLDRIRQNTEKIIGILKDPALAAPEKKAERRAKTEDAADERFDWVESARRSLGAHWEKRTDAEKREFADLFSQLARDTYLAKLARFSDEPIRYVAQNALGGHARVTVEITAQKTLDITVIYYLRKCGDEWLAYDVAIDGVRIGLNYRTQFSEMLEDVSYPEFLAKLRAKCAALASRRPAGAARAAVPQGKDPFVVVGGAAEEPIPPLVDPLEPMNRVFYRVDETLYAWVIRPAAQGYKFLVPDVARGGISNFFSNLGAPLRAVCCLLQVDTEGAGAELARFGVNTTIGVLGFSDPARSWLGLRERDADFGQTFGLWGMGPGWYLYWPLLGPSCGRGTLGLPFQMLLDPVEYLPGLDLVQEINDTSLDLAEHEETLRSALDPYVAVRDAYHQRTRYAIQRCEWP